MTKKPTSLSDVMAKNATAEAPSKPSADGEIRTLTLRLQPMVHASGDGFYIAAITARAAIGSAEPAV